MSYPKIATLVNVLLTQTSKGELNWSQTEKTGNFQASFPRYSVRIYPQGNDYILQILNELGDIVEEVSDPELRDVLQDAYKTMGALHDAARRNAMGVESALDDILGFLDPS
ncbi:MAG: hypothetical protein Q7U27_05390 [Pseudomonas sp.]|uniref:hypothetical protein n=1 Tax=Pseudomonas sp. TaxID=306 RepID=UPI00271E8570|nr:hypothetical protein [Pseudomonas sp.]MDO9328151.1 hypothetical protein [Pseudomonas sp.]